MLQKLARFFRNNGLDAEYLAEKNKAVLLEKAQAEGRIVVTRDKKLYRHNLTVPIFLITNQTTTGTISLSAQRKTASSSILLSSSRSTSSTKR